MTPAPRRRAAVLVAALLASACQPDERALGPDLALQKLVVQADGAACFATCIGSPEPDAALALAGCGEPVGCGLVAAEDQLRVVIDYAGLAFSPARAAPAPTLTLRLTSLSEQGVALAAGQVIASDLLIRHPPKGERAFFSAQLNAPAAAAQLLLAAEAGDGYRSELEGFTIAPAPLALRVDECGAATDDCVLAAAVGVATVRLSLPQGSGASTALLSASLNGVPQVSALNLELLPTGEGDVEATIALPVPDLQEPAGPGSDRWEIRASLPTLGLVTTQTLGLQRPDLTLRVPACGDTPAGQICTLPVEDLLEVEVVAPPLIKHADAQLRFRLDGMAHGPQLSEPLVLEDVSDRVARFVIAAPSAGSDWALIARVGPYALPTYAITLE